MKKEIFEILYKYIDDDGNEGEDLFEVQLLEKAPQKRVDKLIQLLEHEDQYICLQAMLILIAWGKREGLRKLDEFINNEYDKFEKFYPHRIWGQDNVYDEISDALFMSIFKTKNENLILPYLKKILSLYGDKFFESKFKSVLLESLKSTQILIPEIKEAIELAIKNKRYYQASQFLPIIAKYDNKNIDQYILKFNSLIPLDERIKFNIEESNEILQNS